MWKNDENSGSDGCARRKTRSNLLLIQGGSGKSSFFFVAVGGVQGSQERPLSMLDLGLVLDWLKTFLPIFLSLFPFLGTSS